MYRRAIFSVLRIFALKNNNKQVIFNNKLVNDHQVRNSV
jgi:hypothetical protein